MKRDVKPARDWVSLVGYASIRIAPTRRDRQNCMDNSIVCFVTITVPDLIEAEAFYTEILGFSVTRRYAPTKWLSLSVDERSGPGFGLIENRETKRPVTDMVDFWVNDLISLFEAIRHAVKVVEEPQIVPWGSFKAVIEDPFGNQIGLVQRAENER